jgi:hypothetical protein
MKANRADAPPLPPARRRPGRPRNDDPVVYIPARKALYNKLLTESEFLRKPLRLSCITTELNLPKKFTYVVGEVIEEFVDEQWLCHSGAVWFRPKPQNMQLLELWGMRLYFERLGWSVLMSRQDWERQRAAVLIEGLLNEQRAGIGATPSDGDSIEWVEGGMDFHCEFLKHAGWPNLAVKLKRTLRQIRMLSCAPRSKPEERKATLERHVDLLKALESGEKEWEEKLHDHLKQSLSRSIKALEKRGISAGDAADDKVSKGMWDQILLIAGVLPHQAASTLSA